MTYWWPFDDILMKFGYHFENIFDETLMKFWWYVDEILKKFWWKGNPKVEIIIPNPPRIPLIQGIKLLLIAADCRWLGMRIRDNNFDFRVPLLIQLVPFFIEIIFTQSFSLEFIFYWPKKGNPKVEIIIPNPLLIPLIQGIKLLLIAAD